MAGVNLDQLRYVDQQLAHHQLTPQQDQAVKEHRLEALRAKQHRLAELGRSPLDPQEQLLWEKRKLEAEQEVEIGLEAKRLQVPGLEEAWSLHLERERLKSLRQALLDGPNAALAALGTLQGSAAQQHMLSASQAAGAGAAWENLHIQPLAPWDQQQQQMAMMGHVQANTAPPAAQQQVPMKLCRRCSQQKPVTEFYRSKANADGYDGRCKACDAIQCAERRKRKTRVEEPTVEVKTCRRCSQSKPAVDFYRNKTNPDGLYNNCKACFAADAVTRRERMAPLEDRMATAKVCKRCKQTKPSSEFYRNKLMSDGLYSHCKSCYSAAATERSAGRTPAEAKQCRRCKEVKAAPDFYHSKMTADGLQSYCKACYAVAAAQRRGRAADGLGAPGAEAALLGASPGGALGGLGPALGPGNVPLAQPGLPPGIPAHSQPGSFSLPQQPQPYAVHALPDPGQPQLLHPSQAMAPQPGAPQPLATHSQGLPHSQPEAAAALHHHPHALDPAQGLHHHHHSTGLSLHHHKMLEDAGAGGHGRGLGGEPLHHHAMLGDGGPHGHHGGPHDLGGGDALHHAGGMLGEAGGGQHRHGGLVGHHHKMLEEAGGAMDALPAQDPLGGHAQHHLGGETGFSLPPT